MFCIRDASTGKLGFNGAHLDHLVVQNGIHTCRITGIQTNVLYVKIPKVSSLQKYIITSRGKFAYESSSEMKALFLKNRL